MASYLGQHDYECRLGQYLPIGVTDVPAPAAFCASS